MRQAVSHIIPRDDLIKSIIKPSQGIPAYSFLMPGFPASNSDGLKNIQSYDPDTAKQLMADAGYPNGQGFPSLTLWLRDEAPVRQAVAAGDRRVDEAEPRHQTSTSRTRTPRRSPTP